MEMQMLVVMEMLGVVEILDVIEILQVDAIETRMLGVIMISRG